MNLLIILLVMEQNGMYIPAWAMGLAWALLALSVLSLLAKAIKQNGGMQHDKTKKRGNDVQH